MKLALCVVGCGQFARTFARSLQSLRDDIELYFASRDLTRATHYSDMFNGSGAFGSYEAAAADARIEALYLCTPHHLHHQHVAMAARAAKHILVEKPIATTLQDAQGMIADARQAGVTLMVAENYRFMAAVRTCKDLVDTGAVGPLRLIQIQQETHFQPGQWRSHRDLNGGGVFIDSGIHKVHMLRYLAGEPEHIYAARLPQALTEHQGEDGVVLVARWSSGLIGLINHSWTASHRLTPHWVAVSGTEGRIYFEIGQPWLRLEQGGTEETLRLPGADNGLVPMVREFRDSIREGRQPEMSGAEGLGDLAVVLQAYESMTRGESLPISAR